MPFPCRKENCLKQFSTKTNCNKHERIKGHVSENAISRRQIPYDSPTKLFKCPSIDCTTTSKDKYNNIKHLKSCHAISKNKKSTGDNKICSIWNKEFAKRFNRDRHVRDFHRAPSTSTDVEDFNQNQSELPTMVPLFQSQPNNQEEIKNEIDNIDNIPVAFEVLSTSLPTTTVADESELTTTSKSAISTTDVPSKRFRLEAIIKNMSTKTDYSGIFNRCVLNCLKKQLQNNKKEAFEEDFLKWLAKSVEYKPFRLKDLLFPNQHNKRNRQLAAINSQEIYDFWLRNSVTSNDSVKNTKVISKKAY